MSEEQTSNSIESPVERSADSGRPRRKRLRTIVLLVLLLSVVVVLIWYFFLRGPIVPANLIEVSGRIETDDSAIAAKTSGRIKEITVREGDQVTAGQIIATLDDDQLRTARTRDRRGHLLTLSTRVDNQLAANYG